MGKYQRPKGTHDLLPGAAAWEDDSVRVNVLEEIFRDVCRTYNYGEVRTPAFEQTELFKRTIGEGTDIVSKEMYTFLDAGGRSMTLRPEGTAPVVRAYIDSELRASGGVSKLYYIASVFRYERPQKGRFRQHQQFGIEALGADDPALDSEVIQMALTFFRKIGIRNLTLKINSVGSVESRAAYIVDLKKYVEPFLAEFSEEGKARFEKNALRLLDTKNTRELEILSDAPKLSEYLLEDERIHFETLLEYLKATDVKFTIDPYLVRGFDYYTKTAFEIQSPDLGAQNALGGGGRYNQLVEQIGGPPTPGIGFGLGTERALIALQSLNVEMPLPSGPTAFIITLGDAARPVGVKLLSELREKGISGDIDYGSRSAKAQMRAADRAKACFAVIIGDDEIASGTVQVKNLAEGAHESAAIGEISNYLSSRPV